MRTGTFPSGFCCRIGSAGSRVEAGSMATSRSNPSTFTAILILRPKGEVNPLRSVDMEEPRVMGDPFRSERNRVVDVAVSQVSLDDHAPLAGKVRGSAPERKAGRAYPLDRGAAPRRPASARRVHPV